MFDDFDFDPVAFGYGAIGILVGVIMMKFGGKNLNIGLFWKVLTVVACGVGAFILGMIQNRD